MNFIFSVIVFVTSSFAIAGTTDTGSCRAQAEMKAKDFLELVLKSEWGWEDVKYVDLQVSLNSYKVVKNSAFHSQKHEDYVFNFKSASKEDAQYALGSRFEVQMFANQFNASDNFTCYTNSFRLVRLQEGIEL